MTPVKYSQFLHEPIAGWQLVVVPRAGHVVMPEQPAAEAEAVARFRMDFPDCESHKIRY
jgi:hypothetical protein